MTAIRGRLVIDRTDLPWQARQVEEPCVLPNPRMPGRLVMLWSGVSAADPRAYAAGLGPRPIVSFGTAWADESDPLTWHQNPANPVYGPGAGEQWDAGDIRLDAVVHVGEEDAYYVYYSAVGGYGTVHDRVGLVIVPVGPDGDFDFASPRLEKLDWPVLPPDGAAPWFESMASQAAVWRERNAAGDWEWTMYYSYRGRDGTLPGLRMAVSSDGRSWSRVWNDDDPRGMGQIFASTPAAFYEWHQVFKTGATYVLSIEVGVNRGERWRPVLAVSADPRSGWTELDIDTVLQTRWEGLYADDALYHVATAAFFEIAGAWYLFVQACARPASGDYADGVWEMWAVECRRRIPTLPGLDDLYIPGLPG